MMVTFLGYIYIYEINSFHSDEYITLDQADFNKVLRSVRVSVEWSFATIIQNFSQIDFKKKMKFNQADIYKLYWASTFFTNILTCFHQSNIVSEYFNLLPPTIDEYFDLIN